ncbi:VTC domain-containing protein [Streptomyces sp. NBC_01275]|uniref:VTC domain-containing protein n=1 Tax=Streptomyces sp. NBC_01275 TaxID=2903807 RepID=UPI00224CCB7F|nr:VTC domain-containing protein [Streptomyces sp. NBC_01275]MCX4763533.1 VTC domain-containing protein [Streptomyces sp. NBC_01275]
MSALDSVGVAVGALRPVGLDELVARAELLTRLDRKYVLPLADLPFVLGGLDTDVRVLEIDGQRDFGYRSLYLDTPGLDAYLGAARGRRRRFKVRIRSYLDSGLDFLEVKTRGPRGTTVKHRIPYEREGHPFLDGPSRAYVDTVLAGAGIDSRRFRFGPVLTTTYRRTTLLLPDDGSRLTVDTGLVWSLPDGRRALATSDRAVVETKAGRAGCGADRLLWSLGHRPCTVSKYGTGLAALRPELPAHRWLPVLRRHFPTALDGSPV